MLSRSRPVGLFEDTVYTSERLVLPDNFLLLLVSDGLLELMPQKSNRERYKDLLSRVTGPDVTFAQLTEGLGVDGAQQLPDDVTLLSVVKRNDHAHG